MIKHLKKDSNGKFKYRRRVPERLQKVLGKTEFSKVLGRTESEAIRNYGPYHEHVERILQTPIEASSTSELVAAKASIQEQLLDQGMDPYSSGLSKNERLARQEAADAILGKYPLEPQTGHPDPDDLTVYDNAMVTGLLTGVPAIQAELTINGAFSFYLTEKNEPDPYKRRKQVQRFGRIQRDLLSVTKRDLLLSQVSRAHARKLRDNLLKRVSVSSAKRNVNDVKAVFSLAIREHDLSINNPFARLEFPKPSDAAIDLRAPLPSAVILSMYNELRNNPELLSIWTLMHHTGAQNAEILGLVGGDLKLTASVPHFRIRPHGLRSVKDRSRIRNVPLVGHALKVALTLAETVGSEENLFPRYATSDKHDNFSQAVRKKLRKFTDDPKHVVYSLRHNMKDALRKAKVGDRVELAILGHSDERTSSTQYGSAVSLEEMHEALSSVPLAVPDTIRI